jgi:rare lipoprotein A
MLTAFSQVLVPATAVVAGGPAASATTPGRSGVREGLATFYGAHFQGKRMANGARFDMRDPKTVASNDWPLGTHLRIRRVAGGPWDRSLTAAERRRYFGRSIEVVVRDRGAFSHPVDLSQAAFALIGRPSEGVIRVQIEVVRKR